MRRSTCFAALILLASGMAAQAKAPKLEAAYVVLGPKGPVARAVYKHTSDCPSLTLDGVKQPMGVGMLPQSGEKATFPVLVCELPIRAGTTSAVLGKQRLPLPPAPSAPLTSVAV